MKDVEVSCCRSRRDPEEPTASAAFDRHDQHYTVRYDTRYPPTGLSSPHFHPMLTLRYPDVTKHPYDSASFLLPGSCMPSYSPTLNFEIISID